MTEFNVEHHAMLFALIAREVIKDYGETGKEAILEGVRRYGITRGKRMAENARASGHTGNLRDYLLFGELDFGKIENKFTIKQRTPHLEACAVQCAWNHIWRDKGILDSGKLYCQEIDASIVKGFDPNFKFELNGTLTNNDPCCRFNFLSEGLSTVDLVKYIFHKFRIGKKNIRTWEFHTAELYIILENTLSKIIPENTEHTLKNAEEAFAAQFGSDSLNRLHKAKGLIK